MCANTPRAELDTAAAATAVEVRREQTLLKAGALQNAILNSANFSSIATDANGVIQIFNVGAERMLGYTAAEVMNKITPADISDPQEVIFLTAKGNHSEVERLKALGAAGVLIKPFDARTLPANVRALLPLSTAS